jgi:peroxiredoxin
VSRIDAAQLRRLFALITILFVGAAQSAELASAVVGRTKPTWENLPAADGHEHSLSDLKDKEVVVVAVTCNHCPLALEYFDRLKQFVQKHSGQTGKTALVAISLSNQETDKLPRMKELADRNQFNFPYLHDASQEIGRQLGATKTPQFFVLDRNRTLVYRGAWDDSVNPLKVKHHFVEEVVAALLAGKSPPFTETKSIGCIITYER